MKKMTKRRNAAGGPSRPSWFFMIILALGMIFLAMLFVRGMARPAAPGVPVSPPAQTE
jgi:hypothetical protein